MTSSKITTISEFLEKSGAGYQVFDMGRRVVKINTNEFSDFEGTTKPYPYPLKQHALFAVVFWNPKAAISRYIWFLNLPLDEQGLLVQAARDEFLVMLLERVGECMLAKENSKHIQGALKDCPYTFKPREEKMAAFTAQVTKNLALRPSKYYDAALAYYTGESDIKGWQSLGMQGIADVAVRLDEVEETLGLIETLHLLPEPPFMMLATFLENAEPEAGIVDIFSQHVAMQLQEKEPNIARISACLRAVSNSPVKGLVDLMVKHVLQHDCSRNIEILATISGRIWRVLEQDLICQLFIDQLAHNSAGQEGFNNLIADVIYLPGMRPHIMRVLRSPNRSNQLSQVVGNMFG